MFAIQPQALLSRDLKLMLRTDNIRYVMSSCLWGYPDNTTVISTVCDPMNVRYYLHTKRSQPCTTSPACGLYQNYVEFDSLATNASTYDYCSGFDNAPSQQQPRCLSCLQQLNDDFFLSNSMSLFKHQNDSYLAYHLLT
jgi:hypothetical protein